MSVVEGGGRDSVGLAADGEVPGRVGSDEAVTEFQRNFASIVANIETVIHGKTDVIHLLVLSLVCDGHVVHSHHLPPTLQTGEASGTTTNVSLADAVSAYEKDLLQDALKTTRGNRVKAAKLLDSTERIVSYKVKKYGIDCRRFR